MEMLTVKCLLLPLQQLYVPGKTLLKFSLFNTRLENIITEFTQVQEKQKVEELNGSRFADAVNPR